MEEEYAQHTIAIDSSHRIGLTFSHDNKSPDEEQIDNKHSCCSYKSFFFSNCTEDEVGMLLGYIFQFGLRTIEKAFSQKSTRTYCNLGLIDIVSCSPWIIFHT